MNWTYRTIGTPAETPKVIIFVRTGERVDARSNDSRFFMMSAVYRSGEWTWSSGSSPEFRNAVMAAYAAERP